MSTELIAVGTGALPSTGLTIAWGESIFFFLKDADGGRMPVGSVVFIEVQGSSGQWHWQATLDFNTPGFVAQAKGTWRARRAIESEAVGVEYEK